MKHPMDLTGKRILVTGASAGIGEATSVMLSQLGAQLVLVARNRDRLLSIRDRLSGSGHEIEALDLGGSLDLGAWLRSLTQSMGPLRGIVHCAGVQDARPLSLIREADFDRVMKINTFAALALAQGFRQKGVAEKGGGMVYLSSVMGIVGSPGRSIYSASKGALSALTRSIALELARDGLRANCVAPAFVRTGMLEEVKEMMTPAQFERIEAAHPLGFGEPSDVAASIAFLLGDGARWITGTTLVVDGGYTAH